MNEASVIVRHVSTFYERGKTETRKKEKKEEKRKKRKKRKKEKMKKKEKKKKKKNKRRTIFFSFSVVSSQ